jgi:hypothetical protein
MTAYDSTSGGNWTKDRSGRISGRVCPGIGNVFLNIDEDHGDEEDNNDDHDDDDDEDDYCADAGLGDDDF